MLNIRVVIPATIAAVLASAAIGSAGESKLATWLLSGQSNACGRGKLPGPAPDARVQMFNIKTGKWLPAKEPLSGLGGKVGPWHAAALATVKGGGPAIRLTGFASGGQPISYWHERRPGWKRLSAAIDRSAKGAGVFLWYQGETDAVRKMTTGKHLAELAKLIGRVRARVGNPKMTVVVIQIGNWDSHRAADFMAIREAQRQFVAKDANALLVPAIGRKMKDYVHLSSKGYFELGVEIARALLRTKYGKARTDWPGPVLDAAVLGADAKSAVAHFAEARKLTGVLAGDFGVIDTGGIVKCTAATASGTLVRLSFGRVIAPPARLVYGIFSNPKATLIDAAGNRAPAVQIALAKGKAPANRLTSAPKGAGPLPPSSIENLADGDYKGSAKGYKGPVEVQVTVKDGKISAVKIVKHRENRARTSLKVIPARIVEKQSTQVDAVSRATITSKAIMKATARALESAGPKK
jgi:uncharacterized protein with FMN-binding domain